LTSSAEFLKHGGNARRTATGESQCRLPFSGEFVFEYNRTSSRRRRSFPRGLDREIPATDRASEKLFFTRLYVARRFARQHPSSVWADRHNHIRDAICRANMGLVVGFVDRFSPDNCRAGEDSRHNDFLSAANFALLKAVDNFKLEKGFKFSTFAHQIISNDLIKLKERHPHKREFLSDPQEGIFSEQAANVGHDRFAAEQIHHALANAPLKELERKAVELVYLKGIIFEDAGKILGVSKQRAKQATVLGLHRLRAFLLNDEKLAAMTYTQIMKMASLENKARLAKRRSREMS
jgi:RNA polymerase sigma factor (sigma-70 family)